MKTQLQKRAEAELRKKIRETRTAEEQLKILDLKLGKGEGATRERVRLVSRNNSG